MSDTMNTGCVARNMGIPITEDKLTALGFTPVGTDKRARMWATKDFPAMCKAVGRMIADRANVQIDHSAAPAAARKPRATPSTTATGSTTSPVDDDDF